MSEIQQPLEGQKEAWEEIDALVLECQSQDTPRVRREELLEELYIRFEPFINMFIDCLVHDKTYLNNKVQREFIGLYIADVKLRYRIYQHKRLTQDEMREIGRSLSLIRDNYGKQVDVPSDMKYIFTQLVMKYKKTNRSFNAYISYVFKYEVFKVIKAHLRDRLNNNYDRGEYEEATINRVRHINDSSIQEALVLNNDGHFSDTWASGLACADEFVTLTKDERILIAKLYHDKKRVAEIMNDMNIDKNQYRELRRSALTKLEQAVGKPIRGRVKKKQASD